MKILHRFYRLPALSFNAVLLLASIITTLVVSILQRLYFCSGYQDCHFFGVAGYFGFFSSLLFFIPGHGLRLIYKSKIQSQILKAMLRLLLIIVCIFALWGIIDSLNTYALAGKDYLIMNYQQKFIRQNYTSTGFHVLWYDKMIGLKRHWHRSGHGLGRNCFIKNVDLLMADGGNYKIIDFGFISPLYQYLFSERRLVVTDTTDGLTIKCSQADSGVSIPSSTIFTQVPTRPSKTTYNIRSLEPFSEWQTYTNPRHGYAIKHPSYWTVDDHNPDLVYLKENRQGDGGFFSQTINIGVYPGARDLTIMQFLKDIFYANNNIHDTSMVSNKLDTTSTLTSQWLSGIAPKEVAVGDITMETIGWVPNLAGSYGDGYWVTHNNNGYFILFTVAVGDEDKTTEPDLVLSTFRFTQYGGVVKKINQLSETNEKNFTRWQWFNQFRQRL